MIDQPSTVSVEHGRINHKHLIIKILLIHFLMDILSGIRSSMLPEFPFNLTNYSFGRGNGEYYTWYSEARNGDRILSELKHDADEVTIAINFGAGIRIGITEKVALSINLDYYSTIPQFEVLSTSNFMPDETYYLKQKMDILNLSFGIGYRLK